MCGILVFDPVQREVWTGTTAAGVLIGKMVDGQDLDVLQHRSSGVQCKGTDMLGCPLMLNKLVNWEKPSRVLAVGAGTRHP